MGRSSCTFLGVFGKLVMLVYRILGVCAAPNGKHYESDCTTKKDEKISNRRVYETA